MSRAVNELREAVDAFRGALERQNVLLAAAAAPELERQRELTDRRLAAAADPRPRRTSFFFFASRLPAIAALFDTVVPDGLWTVGATGAALRCACGEDLILPPGRPVECACGRFFVFDGDEIRVAGSPASSS